MNDTPTTEQIARALVEKLREIEALEDANMKRHGHAVRTFAKEAADFIAALSTATAKDAGSSLPVEQAVERARIERAIKATEYKYFGEYEMSDDQREAVETLVETAETYLATIQPAQASDTAIPAGEVVAWVSPGQLAAINDRPGDTGGEYMPIRKSRAGNFTLPLYARPSQGKSVERLVEATGWTKLVADHLPHDADPQVEGWRIHNYPPDSIAAHWIAGGLDEAEAKAIVAAVNSFLSTPAVIVEGGE